MNGDTEIEMRHPSADDATDNKEVLNLTQIVWGLCWAAVIGIVLWVL